MATPDMREIGSSGLKRSGGYVQEEFLRDWLGPRRNKIIADMLQDATVGGVRLAIDMVLRRAGVELKPVDDTPQAEEVRQFVDECIHDMSTSWEDIVCEIFSMLDYGWEYSELVYKRRLGYNRDAGKASKHDDGRIGWRKWAIRSQDSLDHWEFDSEGGLQGMWQHQDGGTSVLIPIGKSLLFRTSTFKGNPEGKSILRTAYASWYYKHNIERIEAIGIERDLAGLPVIYMPPEYLSQNATDDQKALFNAMKELVTNIRRDEQEGVIMPMMVEPETKAKLFELTLLSSGGERQFDTDKVVARYDRRIAIAMLADFILLGHEQVGSYALSQTKTSMFRVALEAWLGAIAAVVNMHAIPRLLLFNGMPLELAPQLCFSRVGEIELADMVLFIEKYALAGGTLFPHLESENYLRQLVGLPQLTEEEYQGREDERRATEEAARQARQRQPVVQPQQGENDEQMSVADRALIEAAQRVLARGV